MPKSQLVDLSNDTEFKTFWTPAPTATRYGSTEKTLANHRVAGTGLPYYKNGKAVLYCIEECDEIVLASRQSCDAS